MTAHHISRRTLLRTTTATAAGAGAAVVIAACSSSSTPSAASSGTTEATDPANATTDPATAAAASTGQSGGASAAPDGTKIADLSQIPVGGSKSTTLSGAPIVLTQTSAGTVVGFSAKCPHQGCTVAPAGKRFDCPCHGSSFDAATGKVLGGPAPRDLTPLSVTVADGVVYAKKG